MKYLLILCILCSCSKSSKGPTTQNVIQVENSLSEEMNGNYQAILVPLNQDLSGKLNGALNLVRENNEFIADVRLSGARPNVLQTQQIHIGKRCPLPADDLNQDGFIDAEEGFKVYEEVLIPLDDDLSSQRMGGGIFPATDDTGYYYYTRITNFNQLLEDLKEEDINLSDDYVKLRPREVLQLKDRVVIIAGVSNTIILPDSVSGRGRLSKNQALPIACGVIRELKSVPGVVDNDYTGMPLPEGGAIGGSNGEDDDGADFSTPIPEDPGNYGDEDTDDENSV